MTTKRGVVMVTLQWPPNEFSLSAIEIRREYSTLKRYRRREEKKTFISSHFRSKFKDTCANSWGFSQWRRRVSHHHETLFFPWWHHLRWWGTAGTDPSHSSSSHINVDFVCCTILFPSENLMMIFFFYTKNFIKRVVDEWHDIAFIFN